MWITNHQKNITVNINKVPHEWGRKGPPSLLANLMLRA